MNRFALAFLSLAFATSASSCFLYLDDDDPCDFGGPVGGDQAPQVPENGRINAETGQCEFSGGGPRPCDDLCGPCPETRPADQALEDDPRASWAFCQDQCTGLDENTCLATDACRGIYNEADGFEACWGTDFNGPVRGGDCTQFGALECSTHDDCIAVHISPCNADADSGDAEAPSCELQEFLRCDDEPGNRNPGMCYGEVACDADPPECPAGSMPGIDDGCWTGYCIPVEDCERDASCEEIVAEATCVARTDCAPTYRGIDCVCDDTSCTCADHEFDSCLDAP